MYRITYHLEGSVHCTLIIYNFECAISKEENKKYSTGILWFGSSDLHECMCTSVFSLYMQMPDLQFTTSCFMFSVTNLKYWGRCEPVISRTLQFLNDLSVGYPFCCVSDHLYKQPNKCTLLARYFPCLYFLHVKKKSLLFSLVCECMFLKGLH